VSALGRHARRILATAGVTATYAVTRWVSRRFARARAGRPTGCIVVIGTFHNPNWFHSHIRPLARSGVGTVVLICDEPVDSIRGVRVHCPPRLLQVLVTRAGAKLVWAVLCGWRYRPDLYMVYHIFPCALIALFVARLFGRPASYQVTSGVLELEGGGWVLLRAARTEPKLRLYAEGTSSRALRDLVRAARRLVSHPEEAKDDV